MKISRNYENGYFVLRRDIFTIISTLFCFFSSHSFGNPLRWFVFFLFFFYISIIIFSIFVFPFKCDFLKRFRRSMRFYFPLFSFFLYKHFSCFGLCLSFGTETIDENNKEKKIQLVCQHNAL